MIIIGIYTVLQDIINKHKKLRSIELLEKLAISVRNSFRFAETQGSLPVHKTPLQNRIWNHFNPVHIIKSFFFMTSFKIISTRRHR